MTVNQSQWPQRWLMTDERLGSRLWDAVEQLPARAGIIFRHYSLNDVDRLELGRELARVAADGGLVLAVAGNAALAAQLGASFVHNPDGPAGLPCSMAVHDEAQARAAREAGAALAFVGPIHPTRSHPGRLVLGEDHAVRLAKISGCPAIALGGMNEARFAALQSAHPGAFHGFAGIDCWLNQARTL